MQFGNHLIHNIYYMLAYAFEHLPDEFYRPKDSEKTADEKFDNIFDLLCFILTIRLTRQIKRGFYREYIDFSEEMPVLRGRPDINATIQNRLAKRRTVTCEFDDLSENNIFNRIVRSACDYLMRSRYVKYERKIDLNLLLRYLNGIEPIRPELIRWDTLRFTRNNRSYQELLNICRFILTHLLLSTEMGDNKLSRYWSDERISHLYEKFILTYYRKHYHSLHANPDPIKWATSDEDRKKLPGMISDITLHGDNEILIIDAKYYGKILVQNQYGDKGLNSPNLYQLFSYVMNRAYYETNDISGMLLYASTKEENSFCSDFVIAGHKFYIDTLDLNQEFPAIADHLDNIAQILI